MVESPDHELTGYVVTLIPDNTTRFYNRKLVRERFFNEQARGGYSGMVLWNRIDDMTVSALDLFEQGVFTVTASFLVLCRRGFFA